MIDFTQPRRILVTSPRYITPITEKEIVDLGYKPRKQKDNAIALHGTLNDAMNLNLWLRTAHKVQLHLFDAVASTVDDLYTVIHSFEWENLIPEGDETYISIHSAVKNDTIRDTRIPNLKAKDAIVDRLTEKRGVRPNSGTETDKTVLFLYWKGNNVSVFVDTSGNALNKRGYRLQPHKAPLQETLAAALIIQSGWNPKTHFINPMCGSGTLAIEACLIGTNTAPGLLRENFGFMHIQGYDSAEWEKLKQDAISKQTTTPEGLIVATDKDPHAIEAAKANAERAKVAAHIMFRICDFRETLIPSGKGTIIVNPEYGERLGDEERLQKLYMYLGSFFKKKSTGYACFVVSVPKLLKHIKLQPKKSMKFFNANLDVEFVEYVIYPSRRNKLVDTAIVQQEIVEKTPIRKLRPRKTSSTKE